MDPACSLVDQQRHHRELYPPSRTKLRVTNRKGKSPGSPKQCCGPVEAVWVIPGRFPVLCRWNCNFQMKNNLQVIMSFCTENKVEELHFSYCACRTMTRSLRAGPSSDFPRREAKVCNNHWKIVGGCDYPELSLTSSANRFLQPWWQAAHRDSRNREGGPLPTTVLPSKVQGFS